jgi:hypothetical protein
MPEKKMQLVLADALIAEGFVMERTAQQDSQRKLATLYYSEIFEKYHITKQEYYKSYDFYAHHPALFQKTLGSVIDSLSAMEARIPAKPVIPDSIGPSLKHQTPASTHQRQFQPAKKAVETKKQI